MDYIILYLYGESSEKKHISKHLVDMELLSEEQHGFVQKKSCLTNLLESLEDWTQIIDNNNGLDIIFCDYKKAFDSVPHRRLIKNLQHMVSEAKYYNGLKTS